MPLLFGNIYIPENFNMDFAPLKEKIESIVNLTGKAANEKK